MERSDLGEFHLQRDYLQWAGGFSVGTNFYAAHKPDLFANRRWAFQLRQDLFLDNLIQFSGDRIEILRIGEITGLDLA